MSKAKWLWLGFFAGYFVYPYAPPVIFGRSLGPLIWLVFAALTVGFFGREFVDWMAKKPWR